MKLFRKNKKTDMDMQNDEGKNNKAEQETPEAEVKQQNDNATETTEEKKEAEKTTEAKKEDKKDKKKNALHDMEQKVQEMGEKLLEQDDKYKRLYADFENHRKRTNSEKAELILNGGKDVIKSLLPVIDDLERALQAIAEDDASREGVQLIYNKMMKILEQKGLKPMEVKGEKFNEELHEAVTRIPAPTEEQKGTVIDVVEKGYYLNDKVLRFAKVVVAF